jgi:CheY-like chemotaxis protein
LHKLPVPLDSYILLADDDKDDRILLREALQEINSDIKLLTAEHGKACIDMLNELTVLPDMILLDINMPVKNGKETLTEIKQMGSLESIPIIMYSTSANGKDIDECYKLGANLYIIKPNNYSGLTAVMNNLLVLNWKEYFPQPQKENFVFNPE